MEKLVSKFYRNHRDIISTPQYMDKEFWEDNLPLHTERLSKNYFEIILRYRPRTYTGRITLLVTQNHYHKNPTLDWDHLAAEGLEIHQVSGDHDSYLGEDVQSTAEQLKACLDAAQTKIAAV